MITYAMHRTFGAMIGGVNAMPCEMATLSLTAVIFTSILYVASLMSPRRD